MKNDPENKSDSILQPSSSVKGMGTPGPWEYVPSTEHHGPYVTTIFGSTVCDCYCMSNPNAASVRNGGTSYPINHMADHADANAKRIVLAVNSFDSLVEALRYIVETQGDYI